MFRPANAWFAGRILTTARQPLMPYLVILNLGLVLAIALQVVAHGDGPRASEPDSAGDPASAAAGEPLHPQDAAMPARPLAAYAPIGSAPIFYQGRTPPAVAPAVPTENALITEGLLEDEVEELPLDLLGTVVDNGLAMAFVRLTKDEIRRLYPGDEIAGWTLEDITAQGVRFRNRKHVSSFDIARVASATDRQAVVQRRSAPRETNAQAPGDAVADGGGAPPRNAAEVAARRRAALAAGRAGRASGGRAARAFATPGRGAGASAGPVENGTVPVPAAAPAEPLDDAVFEPIVADDPGAPEGPSFQTVDPDTAGVPAVGATWEPGFRLTSRRVGDRIVVEREAVEVAPRFATERVEGTNRLIVVEQ